MAARSAPQSQLARRPDAVDAAEVARFAKLAAHWWNPRGPLAPLHKLNPLRLSYVRDRVCHQLGRDARAERPLAGLRALDVGCGGGLLSEPLRRMGADVVGIDPAGENVITASLHAEQVGLAIDYRNETVEALAAAGERFDLVTAMEVVEHVPDPRAFLTACCATVAPGGHLVLATLNRTPRAYLLAIVAAENVLRWLPRGSHDWRRFVKPAEAEAALRAGGLAVVDRSGVVYDPLRDRFRLSDDLTVNYMMLAARP